MSVSTKKILVAPLDWGLGHTTRCLPVIEALLQDGHTIVLAAEGSSAKILTDRFPQLQLLPLKGYHIRYSHRAGMFMPKLLLQVPKIISRIIYEHRWLEKLQKEQQFDVVISDNRYGLYHSALTSVIMTHQVQILSGMGPWADNRLRDWHRKMLERFNQCWIVDRATDGLSGSLAHPPLLPRNATYIGTLSQLMCSPATVAASADHCLVLLSGPEPMRSQLEQILWAQCCALTQYSFHFVAGNMQAAVPDNCPEHIQYHPFLGGEQLRNLMHTARVVVCRSGYSTLMDLDWLQKPAIMIPTPGQTEQEYLARHLSQTGKNLYYLQQDIQLAAGLAHIYGKQQYNIPKTVTGSLKILSQQLRELLYK